MTPTEKTLLEQHVAAALRETHAALRSTAARDCDAPLHARLQDAFLHLLEGRYRLQQIETEITE